MTKKSFVLKGRNGIFIEYRFGLVLNWILNSLEIFRRQEYRVSNEGGYTGYGFNADGLNDFDFAPELGEMKGAQNSPR